MHAICKEDIRASFSCTIKYLDLARPYAGMFNDYDNLSGIFPSPTGQLRCINIVEWMQLSPVNNFTTRSLDVSFSEFESRVTFRLGNNLIWNDKWIAEEEFDGKRHTLCSEESERSTRLRNENGFRLICSRRNKHESGFVTEKLNNQLVKHVIPCSYELNASRTGSYIRWILNLQTGLHRDSRAFRDNHRIPGANWAIVFDDIYNPLNASFSLLSLLWP